MTTCWRLVDLISRLLGPEERAAVCGDLAESGESGGEALRQVVGLIVRRQAAVWKRWRPWVALVFLVIPGGLVLSEGSRLLAHYSALYLWLYTNYWNWTLVEDAAYRHDLLHYVGICFIGSATLASVAWSSGLALAFFSRGSVLPAGVVFALLLFFGELLGAPSRDFGYGSYVRGNPANAVVFQGYFYRLLFPVMLQALVVLVPAVAGMRTSLRRRFS
jgi:hypothetical protein